MRKVIALWRVKFGISVSLLPVCKMRFSVAAVLSFRSWVLAFRAVPYALLRHTVRHGFRGAWGDLSPQRGCNVLAHCVPRYGMPTQTDSRKAGGCVAVCYLPPMGGMIAHGR